MAEYPEDFAANVAALGQYVDDMRVSLGQFRNLMAGAANGGPNGDGLYPVTLPDGSTVAVPCMAKVNLMTQVGQGIALAVTGDYEVVSAGANKAFARAHVAFELVAVRASLSFASTAGDLLIDVKKGGVSILSTKISVKAGWRSSRDGGAVQPVIVSAAIEDDAELTVDVLSSGTAAKGLKVMLIGVNDFA